ncbi:hypothetical protein NE237_032465 [Protea cynaroides]|uniref:Uncharacterized protein n=1 Tax=Protea cynaroides TaxID=273540 RepID=A0A9Q0R344_9MAGN|nr:hypothetical protein NE237_032465 [Protea cynaroides]
MMHRVSDLTEWRSGLTRHEVVPASQMETFAAGELSWTDVDRVLAVIQDHGLDRGIKDESAIRGNGVIDARWCLRRLLIPDPASNGAKKDAGSMIREPSVFVALGMLAGLMASSMILAELPSISGISIMILQGGDGSFKEDLHIDNGNWALLD